MRWKVLSWWSEVQAKKSPAWLMGFFRVLSVLYAFLQRLHRRYLQKHKVHTSLLVISVGSPRAGGSGKTPFVRALMTWLMPKTQPVVVCRGYGVDKPLKGPLLITPDLKGAGLVGDEPWMLSGLATCSMTTSGMATNGSRSNTGEVSGQVLDGSLGLLPVIVSPKRSEGCELGHRLGYKVALLDDGMQHYQLHRDLELAIVTKEDFEDELLPAGSLREPLEALERCDWICVKDYALLDKVHQKHLETLGRPWLGFEMVSPHLNCVKKLQKGYEVVPIDWQEYKHKRVLVFAGIARPQSLFGLVHSHELNVIDQRAFADHEPIAVKTLLMWLQPYLELGVDALICTEKDWARLDPSILECLPVELLWPAWEVNWKERASSFFEDLEKRLEQAQVLN